MIVYSATCMNWNESRLVCLYFEWDNLWRFQVFLWLQNARSIKWWHKKSMNNLMRLAILKYVPYHGPRVTCNKSPRASFIPPLGYKLKCVTMTLWWTLYFWEMVIRPNTLWFEAWLRTFRLFVLKQLEEVVFLQLDIGFVLYSKLIYLKIILSS